MSSAARKAQRRKEKNALIRAARKAEDLSNVQVGKLSDDEFKRYFPKAWKMFCRFEQIWTEHGSKRLPRRVRISRMAAYKIYHQYNLFPDKVYGTMEWYWSDHKRNHPFYSQYFFVESLQGLLPVYNFYLVMEKEYLQQKRWSEKYGDDSDWIKCSEQL